MSTVNASEIKFPALFELSESPLLTGTPAGPAASESPSPTVKSHAFGGTGGDGDDGGGDAGAGDAGGGDAG